MLAHSYSTKLSRTCYGGKTPYALLNSSVFRWRQKKDADEDKSRTATGREFQARLQDHRQRNCVIRSVTVYSAVLSGRHVRTNVNVYARSSLIPEYIKIKKNLVAKCPDTSAPNHLDTLAPSLSRSPLPKCPDTSAPKSWTLRHHTE